MTWDVEIHSCSDGIAFRFADENVSDVHMVKATIETLTE